MSGPVGAAPRPEPPHDRAADLERIRRALSAALEAVRPFTPGDVAWERKEGRGDPVTDADRAIDDVLREMLPDTGEGWLSEESVDDPERLRRGRVWVVDPIDGTREFIDGVPEWCVSIGLLEDGEPVAGGILNPATGERILGALGAGVTYRRAAGEPDRPAAVRAETPGRPHVLASRTEIRRGAWDRYGDRYRVEPCGSVAYKLARVAAGLADATWTLSPKNEWDVAGGAALVRAGGGIVRLADGRHPRFNQRDPLLTGLVAAHAGLVARILADLEDLGGGSARA